MTLVVRNREQEVLEHYYNSDEAEFIVVYGRRGVRKTFLVNEHVEGRLFKLAKTFCRESANP